MALGKDVVFAECHLRHSTKNLTWGPSLAVSLSSVSCDTRQRSILYRVLPGWHSTKQTSLPSVTGNTRQSNRLRHRRRNGHFSLPSARQKALGKGGFADALFAEPSLPSVFKALPSVFKASPSALGTRQSY
jgi:hypothetical protein